METVSRVACDVLREETMLVLSRKKNESIIIDGSITLVVIDIHGDKVRIGIDAPKEVNVYRQEIYDAIVNAQEKKDGKTLNSV